MAQYANVCNTIQDGGWRHEVVFVSPVAGPRSHSLATGSQAEDSQQQAAPRVVQSLSTCIPSAAMVRKKVDPRIRTLIENGVKSNHRSLFVLVGDHGRDQVVNLHYILSKARVASRPSVLWCYKKELGFSTHRKKRMRQLKRQKSSGLGQEAGDDNPFELFMTSTNIRWSYYKDSHKVLGQTFGMCVLQDFEALTPNLLARTIETIEGGGIVCLLLSTVNSLQQLFTMTMDVHDR